MALFRWVAEYDTGYEPIDADHRELAALLNHLHEVHSRPHSRAEVAGVLASLAQHTHDHFRREEETMLRTGYPRRDIHTIDHENLCEDMAEVIGEYSRGGYANIEDALENYLKFWLISHILNEDFKLADFLAVPDGGAEPH